MSGNSDESHLDSIVESFSDSFQHRQRMSLLLSDVKLHNHLLGHTESVQPYQ